MRVCVIHTNRHRHEEWSRNMSHVTPPRGRNGVVTSQRKHTNGYGYIWLWLWQQLERAALLVNFFVHVHLPTSIPTLLSTLPFFFFLNYFLVMICCLFPLFIAFNLMLPTTECPPPNGYKSPLIVRTNNGLKTPCQKDG